MRVDSAVSYTLMVGHPRGVLAHIHVPKCAGPSIASVLDSSFGRRHWRFYNRDTDSLYEDAEIAEVLASQTVQAFSSHLVSRFPRKLSDLPIFSFSFLRDPIQQFISNITDTQGRYATLGAGLHAQPGTRVLSTRKCARWIFSGPRNKFRNFHENYVTQFFVTWANPNLLDMGYAVAAYRMIRLSTSMDLLGDFLLVGLVERMEESWSPLIRKAKEMGTQLAGRIPRENVSSDGREDLRGFIEMMGEHR
jgi:hypothetical protein